MLVFSIRSWQKKIVFFPGGSPFIIHDVVVKMLTEVFPIPILCSPKSVCPPCTDLLHVSGFWDELFYRYDYTTRPQWIPAFTPSRSIVYSIPYNKLQFNYMFVHFFLPSTNCARGIKKHISKYASLFRLNLLFSSNIKQHWLVRSVVFIGIVYFLRSF